ncbi:MAG: ChrR family anti-sigma-E factor [Gammaproteobacteria bacterium]
MPRHHPGSGWLMDYACGHLSPAFEIVIASHLLGCPACREDLRAAEVVGAEFMLASDGPPLALTADAIMDSAARTPAFDYRSSGSRLPQTVDLTGLVSSYLSISLDALRWRGGAGGVWIAKLRDHDDDRLWLLRARPGAVLPRHTHRGSELTLVLQGAYVVGEQVFSVGALEDADEETSHQPIVTTTGECVCLAATSAPLRFDGWAARLAQRFLGI